MSNTNDLKYKWIQVLNILSKQFNDGQPLDLENVIYLIGVQELGQIEKKFNKEQKVDLMHVAICRLLEPFGFYEFEESSLCFIILCFCFNCAGCK